VSHADRASPRARYTVRSQDGLRLTRAPTRNGTERDGVDTPRDKVLTSVSAGRRGGRPGRAAMRGGDALSTTSERLVDAAGAPAIEARGFAQDARVRADRALFARYVDRRDPVDRDVLVERFLPLARGIARRYERPGEPFDDLFQVACVGLINAIDRFELGRGVAFSSYAVPTILGEIKRYYRDRTWAVRVPRDLQDLALRVDRTVTELSAQLHRQPTVGELALTTRLAEEQVLEGLAASAAYRATSLTLPRGDDGEAGRILADTLAFTDDGFGRAEQRATLERLLRMLAPRDREVLRLRFAEDLTQAEIGARVGLSQMQVSRIIRRSLARLRAAAERTD
jgi:RNA polymerase sigma-B factor